VQIDGVGTTQLRHSPPVGASPQRFAGERREGALRGGVSSFRKLPAAISSWRQALRPSSA